MGRLVDLALVTLAIDSACTVRYGQEVTNVIKSAVWGLPSPPFVPSPKPSEAASQKREAFNGVFVQGQALTESLDKLAKWMPDAETDDVIELQRMANGVSNKVDQFVSLRCDCLQKQIQSIRRLT